MSAVTVAETLPAPMLEVEGLNQYYGGSHILRDVQLTVPNGQCTVLLEVVEHPARLGVAQNATPRADRVPWAR